MTPSVGLYVRLIIAHPTGFEPITRRLTTESSTVELEVSILVENRRIELPNPCFQNTDAYVSLVTSR
jgi:hypothetical protein